jgi:hypothetical protein
VLGSTDKHDHRELAGVVSEQLKLLKEADISGCDTKLLLIALRIIQGCGYRGYAMADYARSIARVFNDDGAVRNAYIGEAILLSQLGLSERPSHCDSGNVIVDDQQLHGDMTSIRALYARLCAATHYGTRECPEHPERGQVEYVIKVLLIDAFRNYDIATGTMLLRAATYLNLARDPVIVDAQSFLRLQQLSDGRFGQYDLVAHGLDEVGLDAKLDLYLPLAVSCVWALVEFTVPTFRVFSLTAARPTTLR